MSSDKLPSKFSWGWLLAQFPAVAIGFQNYETHNVEVGVGMGLWLLTTAFAVKIWHEVEDDAVKGAGNLLRAAPHKAMQILKRTRDWLVGFVNAVSPGYKNAYLRELRYRFGRFNDKGLGLINANRLALKDVYIDLAIDPDPQLEPTTAGATLGASREPRKIWDYLNSESLAAPVVIIGLPGTGKTTLVHHVLLTYAQNSQKNYRAVARVPLYFEIRLMPEIIGKEKLGEWGESIDRPVRPTGLPRLTAVLIRLLSSVYADLGTPPDGWLERQMRLGKALLLLDGLDEVRSDSIRKGLSRWLDDELSSTDVRKCPVIITARPGGYRTAPLSRATLVGLRAFSREQAGTFISRWYLANETVSHGNSENSKVRREANAGAIRLIDALRGAPQLYELTSNPLLLTMVCMVHRYRGTLPGSRVQLYSEICQVLLERWRQARGMTDDFRGEQKLLVLQPLAARMMLDGVRDISDEDAQRLIQPILERFNLDDDQISKFLGRIQEDSGLISEKSPGRWGFAHLSFQEYLTATHWRSTEPPAFTGDFILQPWWREVLLLYAPYKDVTDLIECALALGTPEAIALALDIDKEAMSVDKATKAKLEVIWRQVLRQPADPRFVTAAEALLVLNAKREYKAIEDDVQIRSPICQAEYQLFLMDFARSVSPINREFVQCMCRPLAWRNQRFEGNPDEPVVGLFPWQRFVFAWWLKFRFPNYVHWAASASEIRKSPDYRPDVDIIASREENQRWNVSTDELTLACRTYANIAVSHQLINRQRREGLEAVLRFTFQFVVGIGISHPSIDEGLIGIRRRLGSASTQSLDIGDISFAFDDGALLAFRVKLFSLVHELHTDVSHLLGTDFVQPIDRSPASRFTDQDRHAIKSTLAEKRSQLLKGKRRLTEFFHMPEKIRQTEFALRVLLAAEIFFGADTESLQHKLRKWLRDALGSEDFIDALNGSTVLSLVSNEARGRRLLQSFIPLLDCLIELDGSSNSRQHNAMPLELGQPLRVTRLQT